MGEQVGAMRSARGQQPRAAIIKTCRELKWQLEAPGSILPPTSSVSNTLPFSEAVALFRKRGLKTEMMIHVGNPRTHAEAGGLLWVSSHHDVRLVSVKGVGE